MGRLEHWNYDTFRATWNSPLLGKSLVTFHITGAGTVGDLSTVLAGDTLVFKR
jgi:hypothetical protein